MTDPTALDRIDAAIRGRDRSDPFAWIKGVTDEHRRSHGCWAYPYQGGSVLGAIIDTLTPSTVLELGTALGYTACWWARDGARVDTIERDRVHVRLARTHVTRAQPAGDVTVHEGDFAAVLPTLTATYDLGFFDGYEPPPDLLADLAPRLAPDACLVTTNLDLGGGRYRSVLSSTPGWKTHFVQDLAVSIRA